jgi:hypothetical protein
VRLYQQLAQRWLGPVGWLVAVWTRILVFGTGLAALLRFGNPVRQLFGAVSVVRRHADSKKALDAADQGTGASLALMRYDDTIARAWPEIAEKLIDARFAPAVREAQRAPGHGDQVGQRLFPAAAADETLRMLRAELKVVRVFPEQLFFFKQYPRSRAFKKHFLLLKIDYPLFPLLVRLRLALWLKLVELSLLPVQLAELLPQKHPLPFVFCPAHQLPDHCLGSRVFVKPAEPSHQVADIPAVFRGFRPGTLKRFYKVLLESLCVLFLKADARKPFTGLCFFRSAPGRFQHLPEYFPRLLVFFRTVQVYAV